MKQSSTVTDLQVETRGQEDIASSCPRRRLRIGAEARVSEPAALCGASGDEHLGGSLAGRRRLYRHTARERRSQPLD
ncbi:hypothetical protein EYF80_016953 [Liparis tanakae]|uniref:Uncharacterized protein n=1 Tax=Liparis tanakae TaxID=230148 RepID=A0A4Z2I6C3_9TELE|nr:hypothetical protein EYF80_016953 [Liparis tanakae]